MFMRSSLLILAIAVGSLLTAQSAFAGTTGSISGRITDTKGAPIAAASISAFSSTQALTATTDASGNYGFASLTPDQYTITVTKAGYRSVVQDTAVFADQSVSLSIQLQTATGSTATAVEHRSTNALLQPGVTSNVYSMNASEVSRLAPLSGSGNIDHAYSAMQTIPGIFIPPSQMGWYQILSIRGGDQDQVGYEFDGIPVVRRFDNTPITMLSTLGEQELQVYTGGIPATSDATSISGYINQVVTKGTTPDYGKLTLGIGGPAFYHKAQFEAGGIAGRLSYYVATSGINQTFNFYDQNNGPATSGYFYPVNVPLGPAGVYVGGPTLFGTGSLFGLSSLEERESLANFHFSIPHKHGGVDDDLQLLYANSMELSNFYSSLNDLGGACAVNGCAPYTWQDQKVYSGPMFAPFQPSGITTYAFPGSPAHSFGAVMDPNIRDGTFNDAAIIKLQYQHNFSSRAYARAILYSTYSDWLLNGPSSTVQNFGFELADWEPQTHTIGAIVNGAMQLGNHNALTLSASYEKTHAMWVSNGSTNISTNGVTSSLYFPSTSSDFPITSLIDAQGNCYNYQTFARWSCFDTLSQGTISNPTPGAAPPPGLNWTVTENGYSEAVSNNFTAFTSAAFSDEWRPSDRWVVNLGARVENFNFLFGDTNPNDPARKFWFNAYNAEHCFGPGYLAPVSQGPTLAGCPTGTTPLGTGNNPLLVNQSGGSTSTTVWQPRVAFSYQAGPNDVLRGSWGVYARPPYSNWMQYNTTQENLASFIGDNFYGYGFNTPEHNLRPDKSFNMDLSWEHAIGNTGLAFKVTPFLRSTQDQEQIFEINALTALESGLNVGHQTTSGVEFLLRKGNPTDQGLTWSLSYTHERSRIRYSNFAGTNINVIDIINRSIQQYNSYTAGCAGAAASTANDAPCGSAGGANAAATLNGVTNPYYCTTPSASCPYTEQPLLDRNGAYTTYDIFPAPFLGANSYETPDFGALVVNYRKKNWTFTPSLLYNSGASYGSPLVWPGYDPLTCTPQAGTTTADTTTCSGMLLIPDAYTSRYDNLGSFRQPWRLTGNLQIRYRANPRISLRLDLTNVFDVCGQRGYAWDSPGVCVYSQLPSNILAPVGNFMSPSAAPPQLRYPYAVWNDNLNLAYIGARMPMQAMLQMEIKI